ncbi:hypothetical protein Bca4012_033098 [Brassica carinata]
MASLFSRVAVLCYCSETAGETHASLISNPPSSSSWCHTQNSVAFSLEVNPPHRVPVPSS